MKSPAIQEKNTSQIHNRPMTEIKEEEPSQMDHVVVLPHTVKDSSCFNDDIIHMEESPLKEEHSTARGDPESVV